MIMSIYIILLSFVAFASSEGSSVCNPPKRVYNFSADVIIGGLVPVHVSSSHRLNKAGIMWVEAMMYAIREINANRSLLPNIKLGFDIRDSCNKVDLALEAALDFILLPPAAKNHLVTSNNNNSMSCVCMPNNTNHPRVMAVVGGASSGISITVSPLFSVDEIPQISYSSTSPSLSDKQRYPSFLRTIPSDVYQAEAIADILAYYNWTYVSIVVTDDEYGRNGLVALRARLKNRGICIAVEGKFTKSPEPAMKEDMEMVVAKLKEDERSNVVVLWCDHPQATGFLQFATGKLFNITWIGTESWGDNAKVKSNVDFYTIRGMLGVLPYLGQHEKFEEYLTTLTPMMSHIDNPWLAEYWAEEKAKCGNCSDAELPSAVNLPFNKYANVMDAVYAIAYGLQSLQEAYPTNMTLDNKILPELLKHIKKVKFLGRSGKGNFQFSDTGDPGYGTYLIKNLQKNRGEKEFVTIAHWDGEHSKLQFVDGVHVHWSTGGSSVPRSRCSEVCEPGFTFVKSSRECCWSCVRCVEDYVKSTRGNTYCVKCDHGYMSNANRTECIQLEVDFLRWSSIPSNVVLVFSFLGLVCVIFVLAVFRKYSRTAVVKASNRELSAIHLICHGVVFLLPALFIGRPNATNCILRSYFFMIFFTLITSITFLKTDRIVRIFNSKSRLTKRSRLLSNKVQLMLTLAMTSIPTAGTTVWVLLRPLTVTSKRIVSGTTTMVLYCGDSAHALHLMQLSYVLLIALLCTYEAYNARRLPQSFNEAKYICFSMFGFVLMWLGYIPGYLDTLGSTEQFITCLFLLLTNYTTLLVIYVPKINIILFHPEANRHETFRRQTMRTCLELAARIPSGSTPDIAHSRRRSTSLPNAFQTTVVVIDKPRAWSALTSASHEELLNDKARRASTPSPQTLSKPILTAPKLRQKKSASFSLKDKPVVLPPLKPPLHAPKRRQPIEV